MRRLSGRERIGVVIIILCLVLLTMTASNVYTVSTPIQTIAGSAIIVFLIILWKGKGLEDPNAIEEAIQTIDSIEEDLWDLKTRVEIIEAELSRYRKVK